MSTAPHPPYQVVIVEDDQLLRKQLCTDLGADVRLSVIGEADDWETGAQLLEQARFDIALLDLQLGERLAHDLIAPASARGKVVVQSVYGDVEAVVTALAAGAVGYLHKGAPTIDIANTLCDVMVGLVPISPTVAGHLLSLVQKQESTTGCDEPAKHLTKRELEILQWLARGLSYREVSERCAITTNTVAYHVKQIYQKLHVTSRGAAVFQGINRGLIRL